MRALSPEETDADLRRVLDVLGAAPLAPSAAARLDEDGFVVFPALLPAERAARLARRCDELAAAEGERAGAEQHQEPGCVRVADLVNKDPLFDVCWTHPLLLSAVAYVLRGRALRLSALSARDPGPGSGHQGMHADWPHPAALDDAHVCNSVWMLDAFTGANGATRVVPGTHRVIDRMPYQDLPDLEAAHPRETLILGPPGTLAVFSSHLWHSGTRNRGTQHRRSIFAYFTRREHAAMVARLSGATAARLTPAARWLLGV